MPEAEEQPRIPLVTNDEADPATARIFDEVAAATGRIPNLYRVLANAPELLEAWIAFAWPLRHDSVAPRALRELVIMRTAQRHGVDYEWRQHWPMAIESGLDADQLRALRSWQSSELFSGPERAALALADDLAAGTSPAPGTWDSLRSHFSDRECLELVLTASFYSCVSKVLDSLEVPLERSARDTPSVEDC